MFEIFIAAIVPASYSVWLFLRRPLPRQRPSPPAPRRPGAPGPTALRHLQWELRTWVRHHDWTEDGEWWRGTIRGCPVSIRPDFESGGPVEIVIEIAHTLTPQTVTPVDRGVSDIEVLTQFFDDETSLLRAIRVRPNDVVLWFPPLTGVPGALEMAEAIVTALVTIPSTQPFR